MLFSLSPWVIGAIICLIFLLPVLYLPNRINIGIKWDLIFAICPTVVLLTLHPDEQPRAGHLPAGLSAVGLLRPRCGLWPAGRVLWHAHPFLYGCRGGSTDRSGLAPYRTRFYVAGSGKLNVGSLFALLSSLVSASDCSYRARHYEVRFSQKAHSCACTWRMHRYRIGLITCDTSYFVQEHFVWKASLSERSWWGEANLLKCSLTPHYNETLKSAVRFTYRHHSPESVTTLFGGKHIYLISSTRVLNRG